MKYNGQQIPDEEILNYIERAPGFRKKVARLLASIAGNKSAKGMSAEERTARAKKAVAARIAKKHSAR